MKNKITILYILSLFLMVNSYVFSQTKTPNKSNIKTFLWTFTLPRSATYGPMDINATFEYYFFKETYGTKTYLNFNIKTTSMTYEPKYDGYRFKYKGKIYSHNELQSFDSRGMDGFSNIKITGLHYTLFVEGFPNRESCNSFNYASNMKVGEIPKNADMNSFDLNFIQSAATSIYCDNENELLDRINNFEKGVKNKSEYRNAIQKADQAFQAKNWTLAKQYYNQASSIFPEEDYPKTQLDKIKQEEEKLEAAKNNAIPPTGNINAGANSNNTNKNTKNTNGNTNTDKINAEKKTSNTTTKTTTKTDATKSTTNENTAEKLKAEEARRAEEKRIADAKAKAEEDAANVKRQQEYDSWKKTAQADKDLRDAESIAASIGFLTILGGFIYDGMGEVDPYSVYQAPNNKYKPLFYMTNSFGYSFSMEPMLFQSNYSTMVGGKTINTTTMKGETGYYFNLGGQSNIGFQNDFYSLYGILGGKLGFEPTLSGFKYNMKFGFGGDVGFKNVKFYTTYQYYLADYKSTTLSDVEERGEGEYDLNSDELGYGIKFTFGGDKSDDFQRQHIYLGYITKSFNFDGYSLAGYYNPTTNLISSTGTPSMEGFNFEWRKDHSFSLFFHYFDEHIFAGTLNTKPTKPTGILGTDTFFEIGFLRAFDLFTHD
jgi:hypothetical protein